MSTATPAEVARWLRSVADQLERSAPAPLTAYLLLEVSEYETELSEAQRVSAVDAVASVLGVTASPTKVVACWEHTGQRNDGAQQVAVSTRVADPRLCAGAAACSHA